MDFSRQSLVTEIGGQIGWLAALMNLQFKQPVYAEDELTCERTIGQIDERGRAHADVIIRNSAATTISN